MLGYLASFIAWSWSSIKSYDKGKGVILSATWLCPLLLITRVSSHLSPSHRTSRTSLADPSILSSPDRVGTRLLLQHPLPSRREERSSLRPRSRSPSRSLRQSRLSSSWLPPSPRPRPRRSSLPRSRSRPDQLTLRSSSSRTQFISSRFVNVRSASSCCCTSIPYLLPARISLYIHSSLPCLSIDALLIPRLSHLIPPKLN